MFLDCVGISHENHENGYGQLVHESDDLAFLKNLGHDCFFLIQEDPSIDKLNISVSLSLIFEHNLIFQCIILNVWI